MVGSMVLAALVSRRPGLLLRPQFWAEDGLIFYQQAHELGFVPALLNPYAGYPHTLPRLIAGLAQLLPLSAAPLLFNCVGLVVQSLPAIYVSSSRMAHLAPLPVRLLLGFLYVGVPNVWRVHGNLTNAQWHLAVLCFLILIAAAPKSVWAKVFDVTALAVGSVTGPFVVFLLPVAAVMAWARRDPWAVGRGVILAVGAVIIGSMIVSGSRPIAPPNLGASVLGFCRIFAFQIFVPVFWGANDSMRLEQHPQWLSFVSCAVTVAGVAFLAYVFVRGSTEMRCFLLFVALQLAASLASPLASATEPQWVALQRPGATHRYWMLPEIGVSVAVVAMAAMATHRLARGACAALIGVILIVDVVHWRLPELPDLHFDQWVAAFEKLPVGATIRIPIPPPKWHFVITKTERD